MARYAIAVLGVLALALDQCLSQYASCSGDLGFLNDGYCDSDNNNVACDYDGGDCCACTCVSSPFFDCGIAGFNCRDPACPDEDPSPYPNCTSDVNLLNDGWCAPELNTPACGYDGGDCCGCNCTDGPLYPCGSNGFNCTDPACLDPAIAVQYPECAGNWLSIGDGLCDAENNNLPCGYDGGDCCLCTCSGSACATNDFNCLDPSAGDEVYDCKPPPAASVPCSADGQRVWVVENSAQARALAEAVNCSGGSFEVLWRGEVVVDKTIRVFAGTFLNVTGAGSISSMDGNSANRLLTVVNASVHITGVNMSYGAGTVGGAIAAVRSNLTLSGSTFFGNVATGHGGAVYASDSSVVSLVGHNSFSDNTAAMGGGAVFVLDSLCTGESVAFFDNTAGGNGGAMLITEHSSLSWSGNATYHGNRAVGSAGALAVQRSASASWHGETSFDNNSALRYAGALHVLGASHVAWNATTIFSNNTAGFTGGAMRVTDNSSASCNGSTIYEGNAGLSGGAMRISGGSAVCSGGSTTFSANSAEVAGGGVFVSHYSSLMLSGETVFLSNVAERSGAVVAYDYAIVTLSGETMLSANLAEDGGAVSVQSNSNLSFDGMTIFHRNVAVGVNVSNKSRSGGALEVGGSIVRLSGNTTFSENTAETQGGAVYVSDSSIVAWDGATTFSGNVAGRGGAVYATSSSDLYFDGRTTFHGNLAKGVNISDVPPSGGALAVMASTVTLGGETMFADNQALGSGGAVIMDSTIAVWTGISSFLNNSGGERGGALSLLGSSVVFDGNTTFHGNSAFHGGAVDADESSSISWDGDMELVKNVASSGGALALVNSTLSWNGSTTLAHNRAYNGSGGALWAIFGSRVSWGGDTMLLNNSCTNFGGALSVLDSSIVFGENTTFHGNSASIGGAVGAIESSISSASWDGEAVFVDNVAGNSNGGALAVLNSSVSWSGKATLAHNRAYHNGSGGALSVTMGSRVSWSGESTFLNNSAGGLGGALSSMTASTVIFDGNISFNRNTADIGGAVHAIGSSRVSWDGDVEFVNNKATAGGALAALTSNVTWNGKVTLAHNRAYTGSGGALWLAGGSVFSSNGESTLNNNSALYGGGAVLITGNSNIFWSGSTTFLSCAAPFGGALFVTDGSTAGWSGRTEFSSNKAIFTGGAVGSSFFDEEHNPQSSTLIINGSTSFANNTAGTAGGGLALNGMLDVKFQSSDVLFIGNSADVQGGAVFVSSFSVGLEFATVKFVANFAGAGGGAYVTGSGNERSSEFESTVYATKFDGCQFFGNVATTTGGAIESVAGIDLISDTTFVGNTAAVGGALRLGGNSFLDNCSFEDNRSGEGDGPAVDNIGWVRRITDSSFVGNVFDCQPGTYLDFNESGTAYEVACNGCRTYCQGCTFGESLVVPICTQAMPHATSSGGGSTLKTISINRGFWRATSTSKEVLACYRDDVCLGGVTGKPDYCLKGYEGPYCSTCSDGYAASFGSTCEKCSEKAGGMVLMVVFVVFVLVGAAAIASYTMSSQMQGGGRGTIERLTRFIPLQSVKIVIVALQIVTQFTAIANVTYPHVYQRFLDAVNVLNFDFGWISQLSVGCLFDIGIHGRLLIATIGPIIAVMFLGLTYVVAANGSRGSSEALHLIRHKLVSMMLFLTFLVYSSVSSILFQMFACDDLDDGKKYLRADYRVECDSSEHKTFQVYAGFMILLYTVGIPAFYASLLFTNRRVLKDEVSQDASQRVESFSDLWKPYKPSVFYYEVIECGRRVLLTGTVVFIYPDTSAQIAVTLMIAFVFAMMSEGLAPFASRWDTWISRMGHVVVFVSMYVALLLKVDVSNERSSSQEVFEGVLVAAHLGMILTVIVETGVMVCSLRETVREGRFV